MNIFSDVLIIDLIFITITILTLMYYYAIKTHNHYKNLGIKYIKPLPFFGNTIDLVLGRKNISVCHKDLYDQLDGENYGGIFMNRAPLLMIRDPELIQKILIKDFSHFFDRGTTTDENVDPLSANLVSLEGQRWKALRQKLTPAFSSGKLKLMFQQFNECGDELLNYLHETVKINKSFDIRETMAKFSTDVIGSCAFGLQFNSLKDPESEFRKIGRAIFKPTFRLRLRLLLRIIHDRLPFLLKIKQFNKVYEDFFINLVKDTIDYREKEKIERNDFIQILMNLQKEDKRLKITNDGNNKSEIKATQEKANSQNTNPAVKDESIKEKQGAYQIVLDDKVLAANTFIFFVAGFETTASTLSFCLLELAVNDEIQTKLRNEVITISNKHNNQITNEVIKEMTYMDRVISETLRKYPPAGSLIRKCTIPYKIPGTSITLNKDERVIIPVYALHHDPKYYPEPENFDPERFNEENKAKRPNGTYLPFGDGPRICIGLRFALTEIKVALTKILSEYQIKLNDTTKLPLKWKAGRLLLVPEHKIVLDLTRIQQTFTN